MKSNTIRIYTQLYHPDPTTTAMLMGDLAEDLVSYGMNVSVVCAQPTYLLNQKCPAAEAIEGVDVKRIRTFLFDKNKILGRIFNSVSCFVGMFLKTIVFPKHDLCVFNTNPALLPLLGLLGLGFKGQKYVVLIHDIWPELPAHTGLIKKDGFIYKTIDFFNMLSLKHASCIIVLSEAMKKVVLKKVPEKKNKLHVIHNWADKNRVYPVAKENNTLLNDFDLKDKKVVMYSGNLGRYQPLEVMINAAEHVKDRQDIFFLFAGDGAKKGKLQEMVRSKKIENVKFIPFQAMDKLAESLSIADVSLMGIFPENEGIIMPSKLYGLLAAGKPIVCVSDPMSEVVDILKKAGAGVHTPVNDSKALALNILSLLDDPKKAKEMGQNGRKYFLNNFERKKITMQWKEVLESICQQQSFAQKNYSKLCKRPVSSIIPYDFGPR